MKGGRCDGPQMLQQSPSLSKNAIERAIRMQAWKSTEEWRCVFRVEGGLFVEWTRVEEGSSTWWTGDGEGSFVDGVWQLVVRPPHVPLVPTNLFFADVRRLLAFVTSASNL